MTAIRDFLIGQTEADRVVPATGSTARLTGFVAAVMCFLAVIALTASFTVTRIAGVWADDLARSATLRLPVEADGDDLFLQSAIEVLSTTPGVADFRVLTADDQRALLDPWLGDAVPLDTVPLAPILEIVPDNPPFDSANLTARLSAQVPGSILDDHARWRIPLVQAGNRVRLIGWTVVGLIGIAIAAMVTLSAQATLAANRDVIGVLRLVGAKDTYIARAFVRRMVLRSLVGACIGTIIGAGVILLVPVDVDSVGVFSDFGLVGTQWIWIVALPFATALVAFFATRAAAFRQLETLT